MAEKKNKNDLYLTSIKELSNEVEYKDFIHKKHFVHLCNLLTNKQKESIEVDPKQKEEIVQQEGMVYMIVIEGKIFKIGHTITNIYGRVQSYNCGKQKHRKKGTCSTTNFFILQSLLHINKISQLYAYFPDKKTYKIFGEIGEDTFPSTKVVERKILKDFREVHDGLPIGCTQR